MSFREVVDQLEIRELSESELPLLLSLAEGLENSQADQLSVGPVMAHIWVLGAWVRGEFVGAVQMLPSKYSDTAIIFDVSIKKQWQNRGIGTKLHHEREKFLLGKGVNKTISTISPWNGPSLNYSLNKNRTRGVRYYKDCNQTGEDKIEVVKNLTTHFFHDLTRSVVCLVPDTQETFLAGSYRLDLERLINREKYEAVRLIRSRYSGEKHNLLILAPVKGGELHEY